jgi:adhesin transport system outer membrane protein
MADQAQNTLAALKGSTNNSSFAADAEAASTSSGLNNVFSLNDSITNASPNINVDNGFAKAVAAAVKSHPKVAMAKAQVLNQQASLGVSQSQLDFQFSGTIYAGVEDVTDETNGIAAVLAASKIMYDGGQIASTISSRKFAVQSAFESYRASLDEQALEVSSAWVDLERYRALNSLISDRLSVLDPLITQLERIAEAGVGDATRVAAAQRTVSMIRVTETDVQERLAQAELKFVRIFGKLPSKMLFDADAVAKAVPRKVTTDMAMAAPALLSSYAAYMSSLHSLEVAKVRNSMTVGFETKVQRPFAESSYDSDESIGFVVRKTLYDGDKLKSEILAAQSMVDLQEASVKDIYRVGREAVETSLQTIASVDLAIGLALLNARALREEIVLLRKQLVIGQSTLDSVLSAEARLYDAESKEINFTADKRMAQLRALSAIGRLSGLVGARGENNF